MATRSRWGYARFAGQCYDYLVSQLSSFRNGWRQDSTGVILGKAATTILTRRGSGIGKCTAERFLKAGAKVVFADIQKEESEEQSDDRIFVVADVTKEEQVKALMETAVKTFGRLDIVVNNAGIGTGAEISVETEDAFDKIMAVNGKGVLFGIKHAAANMPDGGAIINTSSMAALLGFPTYASYAASKATVVSLTKTAALELAPMGIRVNAICPGTIATPINEGEAAEVEMALTKYMTPLGSIAEPEEIAALYHYLASDESSYVTGVAIPFDGGMSAGIGLGIIEPLLGLATRLRVAIFLVSRRFRKH
jgi:3alpha(or 20beta)-hydroxysteroid dehydrogenase